MPLMREIVNRRDIWSSGDTQVAYGQGLFDDYCVYLMTGDACFAPRDEWYFGIMDSWRDKPTRYEEFVKVYDATTSEVDELVLSSISALTYPAIYVILYLGMVAEEKKANTRLGKRIKRLGVHQVLVEGIDPKDAANFSRGMAWTDIARLCQDRGF